MTDLIKEFRELHAKTTQGKAEMFTDEEGYYCLGIGDTSYMHFDNIPKNFFELAVKAHNDFPKILDALEQSALNVEASQNAARAYCDELARYKKALEVCREQKTFLAQFLDFREPLKSQAIENMDQEIDQILEGEG